MEKSEIKGFIAKRCAKELKDGDVVNLGIGLPTLIPNYLPEGVEVIIHAELGIVSAGVSPKEGDANYDPYHVVDAGGTPSSVAYGGGFIDSATNFGLIRGGHVDACFLGALEVDAEGNLANWIIPGKKMPGMGGAMDLCVGAKHCIVCMEHTAKGNPLPRTKEATRDVSHSFLISSRNISPNLYALSANCSSRTTSSAVTATAAAIGFPPKVEPCCPGRITSITSLHDNTAETGQAPPDKAFPKIRISG